MRLINLGCSFSYGNIISEYETFADAHVSPGTLVAKHLDCEEVNIASPGLSLDGVLRRLHSFEFHDTDKFLIGLPPCIRLQYVSHVPRNQDKLRHAKMNVSQWRQHAFKQGPKIPEDWFKTMKWDEDVNVRPLDIVETSTYWSYLHILLIQQAMKTVMNDKLPAGRVLMKKRQYWMYNSVHGHMQQTTNIPEVQMLRDQIVTDNYFKPDTGMHDEVLEDTKYQLSHDDTHPNHLYYEHWAKEFCEWMSQSA